MYYTRGLCFTGTWEFNAQLFVQYRHLRITCYEHILRVKGQLFIASIIILIYELLDALYFSHYQAFTLTTCLLKIVHVEARVDY